MISGLWWPQAQLILQIQVILLTSLSDPKGSFKNEHIVKLGTNILQDTWETLNSSHNITVRVSIAKAAAAGVLVTML